MDQMLGAHQLLSFPLVAVWHKGGIQDIEPPGVQQVGMSCDQCACHVTSVHVMWPCTDTL